MKSFIYIRYMEIQIQNLKAISINFQERKLRNKAEQNWNVSQKQSIFLDTKNARLDGVTGDVIIDAQVSPHIRKSIVDGEICIDGTFYVKHSDPEIERLLTDLEQIKLKGKTLDTVDIHDPEVVLDLIQAGFIEI